jgi:hypothetical protein
MVCGTRLGKQRGEGRGQEDLVNGREVDSFRVGEWGIVLERVHHFGESLQ